MMIDFALDAERREGKSPLDAIYEACVLRFRPIMMTIMAALLGGLPLALATGTGAELRRPLGLTIVGGLTPPGRNTARLGFMVFRDRQSLFDLLDFFWRVFSEGPLQIRVNPQRRSLVASELSAP
jgi:hypothetical protein